MDICCFSDGFLSFFTYVILTNVSNGVNVCMKLPYFMKEISIFAPKPCILRNFRSKRERSGFSLLNLTVLTCLCEIMPADTLWVKNCVKIALSCSICAINKFLYFTQIFKMTAQSGGKTIFEKSRQ